MPRIVVLTGAGISAESGMPTFRDADGLWEGHRVEDVATPEGFDARADAGAPVLRRPPGRARRGRAQRRAPRAGRLERALGDDVLVVTQNIDDLHERGGSTRVLHMHGELLSALCRGCGGRTRWTGRPGRLPALPALRA